MLSQYISQYTWLHRIPAGWKLASLAISSAALLPTQSAAILAAATLVGSVGFLSLGDPGLRRLFNLLRTAGLLAAFVGLFQFVIVVGELGYLDALLSAAISALRLLSLVLLADLISVTTPLGKMLNVMSTLLRPFKLLGMETERLALVTGLMMRSASLVRQHFYAIEDAYRARIGKSAKISIVAPLVRQTLKTSDHLAEALQARNLRAPHQ